jgi:hypothetical protein
VSAPVDPDVTRRILSQLTVQTMRIQNGVAFVSTWGTRAAAEAAQKAVNELETAIDLARNELQRQRLERDLEHNRAERTALEKMRDVDKS